MVVFTSSLRYLQIAPGGTEEKEINVWHAPVEPFLQSIIQQNLASPALRGPLPQPQVLDAVCIKHYSF